MTDTPETAAAETEAAVDNSPISLPAGSYDADKLYAGVDAARALKTEKLREPRTAEAIAAAATIVGGEDAIRDPSHTPGYARRDVTYPEGHPLAGITESIQVPVAAAEAEPDTAAAPGSTNAGAPAASNADAPVGTTRGARSR